MLLLGDAHFLVSRAWDQFFRRGVKIVFGAEMISSPDKAMALLYPLASSPLAATEARDGVGGVDGGMRYLNSGTILGRADHMMAMMSEMMDDLALHHTLNGASAYDVNDQRWCVGGHPCDVPAQPPAIAPLTPLTLAPT